MCILFQVIQYLRAKYKFKKYLRLKKNLKHIKTAKDVIPKEDIPEETNVSNTTKVFRKTIQYLELTLKLVSKMKHKPFMTTGTIENFVAMAIFGLFIGSVISFVYFYVQVYLEGASVFWNFVISMPVLVLMTVWFAFTREGRCYLCLAPFQLFSTSGQIYIGATVMLLMTAGPLMNVHHNFTVMQESSACQQQGMAAAAENIKDILFGPFSAFHRAAEELANGVKKMVDVLQEILQKFKRIVMAITDAIAEATKWINSKINGCKNSVGSSYSLCMNAFNNVRDDCKVKIPAILSSVCSTMDFASNLCSVVKTGNVICDLVTFDFDPLMTTINQRISRLWDRAFNLVYFKINIHHHYHYETNQKTISEEIKEKISGVLLTASTISIILRTIVTLRMLLKFYFLYAIWHYRRLYMRREDFDNYFISVELKKLDQELESNGNTSIFPLSSSERRTYIKVTAPILTKKELKKFSFSLPVVIKTIVVIAVIGLDYSLYFIILKCRLFMLAMMQSLGTRTEVSVVGSGFIAELSRRVVRALNYLDQDFYATNFMPCIPYPKPPDSWINTQIYILLVILWLTLIVKPFALRYRHLIMNWYHPDMARRRAVWLHNCIHLKRTTFLSLITAKLQGKFGGQKVGVSLGDKLRAEIPWIRFIIGKGLMAEECLICKRIKPPLVRCPERDTTSKCSGIYCTECYNAIGGLCTLCSTDMDVNGPTQVSAVRKAEARRILEEAEHEKISVEEETEYLEYSYQGGYVTIWAKENPRHPQHPARFQSSSTVHPRDRTLLQDMRRFHSVPDSRFVENIEDYNQSGFKYRRLV